MALSPKTTHVVVLKSNTSLRSEHTSEDDAGKAADVATQTAADIGIKSAGYGVMTKDEYKAARAA